MKKLFSFVAALLVSGAAMAELQKNEQGFYVINNDNDLMEFAYLVNGENSADDDWYYEGKAEPAANAIVTADISLDGWTWNPIGRLESQYKGTFDGQGHRIMDITATSASSYVGLFGVLCGGAHIQNVIIDSSCEISGKEFVGGIAGGTKDGGLVVIENCGNEGTIICSDANGAGIIGVCMDSKADITVLNCYNTGSVTSGWEGGAISGWLGDRCIVQNCWNTGELTGVQDNRPFFRYNSFSKEVENPNLGNWDVSGAQDKVGVITNEMLAGLESGAFCFAINETKTEDVHWYQKLGEDAHPYPFASHGTVYAVGDLKCDGTAKDGETKYANENNSNRDEHTFNNGACDVCHEVDLSYTPTTETVGDAEYILISSANTLHWFTNHVATGNGEVNAKLTTDIDFSAFQTSYIGVPESHFKGEFDGQNHKITINLVDRYDRTGLFAYIESAYVHNLVVDGTVTVSKHNCLGGLGGRSDGDGTLIENVVVYTDLVYEHTNPDATAGGLFANMESKAQIKNCAFYGSIETGTAEGNGGILGWAGGNKDIEIYNCLAAPKSYTKNGNSADIARNNPSTEVCFATTGDDERLASGELCYELNGRESGGDKWYQTLNTDVVPVPFSDHELVYVNGPQTCDGTPKPGESDGFTNSTSGNRDPHEFNGGAFCSVCGAADANYMTVDEAGYYNLASSDDLQWFAVLTHSRENKDASAKLVADIEYTADDRIGTDRFRYSGEFDGQQHTIMVDFEKEASRNALFDYVENANLHDIVIDGKVVSTGEGGDDGKFAAGLVVESYGSTTIKNVIVKANIVSDYVGDGTHGGILAISHNNLVMENCAYLGDMEADLTYGCGGLIGWSHDHVASVKNSYVNGVLSVDPSNVDAVARGSINITNCWISYDAADLADPNFKYFSYTYDAEDELVSGKLCYDLNAGGNNWYQTLDTDAYPVPFATSKKVYMSGNLTCDGEPDADFSYTNEESEPKRAEHQYDAETGLCSVCERAYKITTAEQLIGAANALVEDFTCIDGVIELAADIDLDGMEFAGIGSDVAPFEGTFDGHNHFVSNWSYTDEEKDHMGLVAYAAGKAVVRNVTVVSSDIIVKGYAAGLVGAFRGESLAIQNCGSEVNVTVTEANAAGILGCNFGGQVTIENCYNAGDINGSRESASICGWLGGGAVVMNVYNIGAVQGADYYNAETGQADYFARMDKGNAAKYINCYEFNPDYNITGFSADDLADGTLCSLLNNGAEGPFVQPEGVDHPVLGAEYTPNGIKNVGVIASGVAGTYSITGMRINAMQKGINIVRLSDGTVRKVLVK